MLIELESVTKLYGRVIGVNDITLSLPKGAYGLLGPNGSGKSTLLNLMMGQLKPTRGKLRVLEQHPINNPDLSRKIGYCPGSEGLYSHVSGLDWVEFLQRLHGMQPSAAREAALRAMELVGMTGAMHRPVASYSRGMRQRTKIAQAIAHDPEFLILDEPFSGLDPIGRHEMTELLHEWIQRGRSLLLASHVLHEVESVTDSFMLICGGRLLASGTSEEVHQLLANLPNEISLKCDDARKLGEKLIQQPIVDSVKIDGDRIVVATRRPGDMMAKLPELVETTGARITELRSADESLNALFTTLMKIHRGEL